MRVYSGTEYASGTAFSATNATSGTFTAPTFAAIRTAGVKFGTVTFDIRAAGVSLGTLAGTLNVESGWTVHNVTDISQAADQGCVYYGLSPAVAVGDQIVFESQGGAITVDSQGFVTMDGFSDMDYYVWDDTDNSWGTIGNFSLAGGGSSIVSRIRYALQSFTKRRRF